MKTKEQEQAGSSFDFSEKIHTLQPLRDLESNWSVDLAKNLEDYLLKICSGEISGRDGASQNLVNFSEAALLLQGSAQVYSRKVEYLYSLVLHALESISQKSEKEQQPNGSAKQDDSASNVPDDPFWELDDIPVDPKNSRDSSSSKDESLNPVVKAPANLVVLEGDCLDTTGDAGELESYLLATCDVYRDFILLDTCDVETIDSFLANEIKTGTRLNSSCKFRKSLQHSIRHSAGVGNQPSARKNPEPNFNTSPVINNDFSPDDDHMPENNDGLYGSGYVFSEPRDFSDSDEDDDSNPWKPLNPHEPGNLNVKPYKRVTARRKPGVYNRKQMYVTTVFPPARIHGTINLHLKDIWEKHFATKKTDDFQSPPLYEKLRHSLFCEENIDHEASYAPEDNEDDDYDHANIPDFHPCDATEHSDDDHLGNDMHTNDSVPFEDPKDSNTHATLEDLCRSHLDSLLANLAESEHQTEMAARVSTWKQRIEQNLNEQDSRPPFDIHEYGNKVLTKLSSKEDSRRSVPFSDIVRGEEKHDIARTFSALLQLVNNGDVELQRGGVEGEANGYTATHPFYVRLLQEGANARKNINPQASKKDEPKVSSAMKRRSRGEKNKRGGGGKENSPSSSSPPQSNSTRRFTFQVCKGARCTPDGKKRRKSPLLEPLELQPGLS